jgi:hypothetical protein
LKKWDALFKQKPECRFVWFGSAVLLPFLWGRFYTPYYNVSAELWKEAASKFFGRMQQKSRNFCLIF